VLELLKHSAPFLGFDAQTLAPLVESLKWHYMPGGEKVAQPDDPCTELFFVLHGRLRVFGERSEGLGFEVVEELGYGGVLGDIELLGDGLHDFRVDAARDTEVGIMDMDVFLAFADAHPMAWKNVAKSMLRHVAFERGENAWRTNSTTIAILPADPDAPLHEFAEKLAAAVGELDSVAYFEPEDFDEQIASFINEDLVAGKWSQDDVAEWDETDRAVMKYLGEQEEKNRFLIFETDAEFSNWTRRCIRQADKVFVVARSVYDPALTPGERHLFHEWEGSDLVKTELVLFEADDVDVPSGTAEWLAHRPAIQTVHHIKLGDEGHMAHLARIVAGRDVGLVLGGGGARGNAHVGVLKALREVGVPIDRVGGTSAGGGMSAMIASGRDVETIKKDSHHAFVEMAPFSSFDLPYASLMNKESVEAPARWLYGELDIEDLWLPFFCVSCDLAEAERVVHRRGRVWKAIRATTALPAVLPPVFLRGQVLVDGGVVDNTPIAEMKIDNRGPTILVDVSPPEPDMVGDDIVDMPNNGDVLLSIFHPLLQPRRVPNIASIIVRTMTVSSSNVHPEKLTDLFIAPAIAGYGVVEFEAMDELVALGYNATMVALEKRHDDPAFLELFHIEPGVVEASMPRMEVPVWQTEQRVRAGQVRRTFLQAAILFVIGGFGGLIVHSAVLSELYLPGAAVGGIALGILPLIRLWAARVEPPARGEVL